MTARPTMTSGQPRNLLMWVGEGSSESCQAVGGNACISYAVLAAFRAEPERGLAHPRWKQQPSLGSGMARPRARHLYEQADSKPEIKLFTSAGRGFNGPAGGGASEQA